MSHLSCARLHRARCPLHADCIIVKASSSSVSPTEEASSLKFEDFSTWKQQKKGEEIRKLQQGQKLTANPPENVF